MKKIHYILIALLPLMAWSWELQAQNDFSQGTGTREDPYIITSVTQLNNVRKYLGKQYKDVHFELGKDLDMLSWANWEPIGTLTSSTDTSHQFYGQFNGNGHVIRNFRLNSTSYMYAGLFGYTETESTIRNLGVIDVDMVCTKHGGAIAGTAAGTIDSCYATGKIQTIGTQVGGICGCKYAGTTDKTKPFSNCYAMVDINYVSTSTMLTSIDLGGLCGFLLNSKIENCFATGNITANYAACVGGLVGRMERSRIYSSYATGNLVGKAMVGGLVGQHTTGEIDGCYAVGYTTLSSIATATEKRIGGLIGYSLYAASITKNCYYNKDVFPGQGIGMTFSDEQQLDVVGLTTEEMKKQSSFTDPNEFSWRFYPEEGAVWKIWEGQTYPYFINQLSPIAISGAGQLEVKGTILAGDTPEEIRVYNNKTNILIGLATIDEASHTWSLAFNDPMFVGDLVSVYAYKTGRTPSCQTMRAITNNLFQGGDGSATNPYTITTPGQLKYVGKHAGTKYASLLFRLSNDINFEGISNAEILGDYASDKLFCATLDGANYAIRNMRITATGNDYVGLFSGIGAQGVLKNIGMVACEITGKNKVGALCGRNEGTVENCFVMGAIAGINDVGSICGENASLIKTTYSLPDVKATGNTAGGLCGNNTATGFISQAYTVGGQISGQKNVGGICGINNGALSNVYATSTVTGTENIGGFCGLNNSTGIITKCYYDRDASHVVRGVGDDMNSMITVVKGFNTEEMKKAATFSDWTFMPEEDATWSIWENNSYPYLAKQASPVMVNSVKEFSMAGTCNEYDAPDSVVIYKNYNRLIKAVPSTNSQWKANVSNSILKNDILYIVSYVAGKLPSMPAITQRLSEDATLKSLSIKDATLSPLFSPDQSAYSVHVPYSTTSITITAVPTDNNATFLDMDSPGTYVVALGENQFKLTVVAADKTTKKTYTLNVLRNEPSDVNIEAILIDNAAIEIGSGTIINYIANCGVEEVSIDIRCNEETCVFINGVKTNGQAYKLYIPEKIGDEVSIELLSSDQTTRKEYTLKLSRSLPAKIISQMWNGDVLTVINAPENNGGYIFRSYQWYADGIKLPKETKQYMRMENVTGYNKEYHVELVTVAGKAMKTCSVKANPSAISALTAYPNPVQSGQTLQVNLPTKENNSVSRTLRIVSITGEVVRQLKTTTSNLSINMPTQPGMYILQVVDADNVQILNIIVN